MQLNNWCAIVRAHSRLLTHPFYMQLLAFVLACFLCFAVLSTDNFPRSILLLTKPMNAIFRLKRFADGSLPLCPFATRLYEIYLLHAMVILRVLYSLFSHWPLECAMWKWSVFIFGDRHCSIWIAIRSNTSQTQSVAICFCRRLRCITLALSCYSLWSNMLVMLWRYASATRWSNVIDWKACGTLSIVRQRNGSTIVLTHWMVLICAIPCVSCLLVNRLVDSAHMFD